MSAISIITTTELECHRCSLLIPVGSEVVLTDFGWVHALCAPEQP